MNKNNLIHVKLEYDEAIEAKRNLLSSEIEILKLAKNIKRYHRLRSEELKSRARFLRQMKELKISVGGLQQALPKINISPAVRNEKEQEISKKIPKKEKEDYSLEAQLREIQERLREIG